MTAILFDLYGTLIDIHTDEESQKFWDLVSRKLKKYHHYTALELKQKYKKLCELKSQTKEEIDILEVFKELLFIPKGQEDLVAWRFRQLSTKYIHCYKGVKKLLKKLKKNNYSLYVLSNAQASFTLLELKKLKIKKYFDGIAISSAYGIKKPNLEFFQRAMKDFELKDAIMIGNEPTCDILPAQQLGLKTIYIESNLTFQKNIQSDLVGFDYRLLYEKIIKF